LRAVTGDLPKTLVPLCGRPLLAWLIADLVAGGISEVILLAGPEGQRIRAALGPTLPGNLHLEVREEATPLGTAGALQSLADRLDERFLLVFGDLFTAIDWPRFLAEAERRAGLACLAVHRSNHPEDSDRLGIDDRDRVICWIGRGGQTHGAANLGLLTNAAVAVFHRAILDRVPRGRPSDLFGEVVPSLVDARVAIHAYRTSEYIQDIGTPERFARVEEDIRAGCQRSRASLVLLDRDGVLVEEVGLVHRPEQLRLISGAAGAVRRLNQAGVRVALVTNQPVVARGLCSLEELACIHARLDCLLAAEGARLDGKYVCPHHPETGHAEGDPALRGPCACRKPATGLAEQALSELGVPAWRCVIIGDRSCDLQLAANAGLASIGLETGAGCRDGLHPAPAVWRFLDLAEAADWICSIGPGLQGTAGRR
jgi:histidinol-phosphate phosphatase family protein